MRYYIPFILILILIIVFFNFASFGSVVPQNGTPKKNTLPDNALGTLSNPIKCDGVEGQLNYLERLIDKLGEPVTFRRLGHYIPPVFFPKHILDKFEISAHDGSNRVEVYMNSYCAGYVEKKPVTGFKIDKTPGTAGKKYKYETKALSARDVYRMIDKYGFYCEVVSGSDFHDEGLRGMIPPGNNVFPSKRAILNGRRGNGIIETQSQREGKPSQRKYRNIRLFWYPGYLDSSFQKAVKYVEDLNRNAQKGIRRWRIPSLMELLSIIKQQKEFPFPPEFPFIRGKSLILWSSTPVKKKGTVLEYDRDQKSYYVIKANYIKRLGSYSLTFGFSNIGRADRKAILIPVYAKKPVTFKPGTITVPPPPSGGSSSSASIGNTPPAKINKTPPSNKIHGFDDVPDSFAASNNVPTGKKNIANKTNKKENPNTGKIHGFDDVPDHSVSRKKSSSSTIKTKKPGTVKITIIPYLQQGKKTGFGSKRIKMVQKAVKRLLNGLGQEIRKSGKYNVDIEESPFGHNNGRQEMKKFYVIANDPNLVGNTKVDRIFKEIISLRNADILVTFKFASGADRNDKFLALSIVIISGIDHRIYKTMILTDTVPDNESIKEFLNKTINGILGIRIPVTQKRRQK